MAEAPRKGPAKPQRALSRLDAIALVVGIVVGAGIFKTPSVVAAGAGTPGIALLLWLVGGATSFVGALCYAELVAAFPHPGGEYHFLMRAYGRPPAFLFAWSRLTVIQTGSIALLAFVFGDYASRLLPLGGQSSAILAAALVVVLTGVNFLGLREGKWTQKILTATEVVGLLLVVAAGYAVASPSAARAPLEPEGAAPTSAAVGHALVFVLLTYGGWNEAAYISSEMRGDRSNLSRALLWGIAVVTGIYLLVNTAFLRGLGLPAMARSEAVAADLLGHWLGRPGAGLVSLLVTIAAATSANGTVLTGARASYALGCDFRIFGALGRWRGRSDTPGNALLLQGSIALALIGLGAFTRSGFSTMVEYTAPVFWAFLFLVGVALIVLRFRDPHAPRPFRVPLYPVVPLLFCATCAYLLWSSVAYTGIGALVGIAVLAAGVPVLVLAQRWERRESTRPAASGSPAHAANRRPGAHDP
jgi:amino acid transporter